MPSILYKADASPPARTVLMVLDLLGVKDVETRDLNPVLREQDAPEYRKKNPMRTVPVLDEGDFSLADRLYAFGNTYAGNSCQSLSVRIIKDEEKRLARILEIITNHAIVLYLIDKYGKPEHSYLYPADKRKRATINLMLFFDCGILFTRLRAVMAPTYGQRLGELSKRMIKNIVDAYEMLETYLEDSSYLAGDEMSVADLSVLTTMSSLHGLHPVDEKRFPRVTRWLERMNEKDVCKRINAPGCELHVMGLKGLMAHNKETQKSKL